MIYDGFKQDFSDAPDRKAEIAVLERFKVALAEEYLGDVPEAQRAEVGCQTLKLVDELVDPDSYETLEDAYAQLAEYATVVAAKIYRPAV